MLRAHLPDLKQRYYIRSLGVFGSYLRGQETPKSDLDILVEFEDGATSLFEYLDLANELTSLLGAKVDLVEKRGLKPFIGQRILAEVQWLLLNGTELPFQLSKYGGAQMPAQREYLDFLDGMLRAMERAERYTAGKTFDEFMRDDMAVDALSKVVENIGEATRHVPNEVRERYPDVDWKRMAGTRDHIAHGYFAIRHDLLWRIATELIPAARPRAAEILQAELKRREARDRK